MRTMLHGRGPNDILNRMGPSVYIQSLVPLNIRYDWIEVRSFYEGMLAVLELFRVRSRNRLPLRGKLRAAGLQILKIIAERKIWFGNELLNRSASLARHLIRTIRDATRVSVSGRHRAWSSSTCLEFCRQSS